MDNNIVFCNTNTSYEIPYWKYLPMTDKQRDFIKQMNYESYNLSEKFDLERENITRGEACDFISKHIDEWKEKKRLINEIIAEQRMQKERYYVDEVQKPRKNYRTPYFMNEIVVGEWGICESEYLGYTPGDH